MGRAQENIMSEENNEINEVNNDNNHSNESAVPSQEELDKIIQDRVNAELAEIKEKLDGAYSQRDEALKAKAALEEEERKREIERLEEEGKHKEAYDMKVASLQAELEAARKTNVELTRDNVVRDALKGLDFKNDTAADFAYRDVVGQLIQNEDGQWVHRTGTSVKDFIESYRKDDDKDFLFKPKQSSGTGTQNTTNVPPGGFDTNKPISEMTTDELMAAAAAGKFDGTGKWL